MSSSIVGEGESSIAEASLVRPPFHIREGEQPCLPTCKKRAAQAIVNIFETGRPLGDHGQVTLLRNDSGHLTYGRSQTTLASGNLHLLIESYCEAAGVEFATALCEYLERLANKDVSLDNDRPFRTLL